MGMPCRASRDGESLPWEAGRGKGRKQSLEPEDGNCAQETGLTGQI